MSANQGDFPVAALARARRVEGRLLCLGRARTLGTSGRGRRAAEAHPHRPSRLAPDLWRAARPRRPARAGRAAFSQAHRPADARETGLVGASHRRHCPVTTRLVVAPARVLS